MSRKRIKTKKIHHPKYSEQSDFMKPYISLNNGKMTECSINKDKIGVELFKIVINSNFGKQTVNVRKYKDTRTPNMKIEQRK